MVLRRPVSVEPDTTATTISIGETQRKPPGKEGPRKKSLSVVRTLEPTPTAKADPPSQQIVFPLPHLFLTKLSNEKSTRAYQA